MVTQEDKDLPKQYVGIDISKEIFEICIISDDGKVIKTFQIHSDRNGYDTLVASIPDGIEPVFSLESTGVYSGNLVRFLEQQGFTCIEANPYDVSRLREAFSKRVKNDGIDAFVLAQAARMNVLKHSSKSSEYIYLQDILERYYDLKQRRTALINQLRANLEQTFPEITKIFRKINSKSALVILDNYPSALAYTNADLNLIKEEIRLRKGKVALTKLMELQDLCHDTVAWKQSGIHERIIRSQVRELWIIEEEIKEIDDLLDEYVGDVFANQNELLQSVPGIGRITAFHTLAILGDHKRFDPEGDGKGAKRVSSFVGFGIREYSSGPRSSKGRISKRGDGKLRGFLFMAAFSAIRQDPEIAAYYLQKKQRCGGKNATVSVAHLLLRRCYGVLKTGRKYNAAIPAAG